MTTPVQTSQYHEQLGSTMYKPKPTRAQTSLYLEQGNLRTYTQRAAPSPTSRYNEEHALANYKQKTTNASMTLSPGQQIPTKYPSKTTPPPPSQYPSQQALAISKPNASYAASPQYFDQKALSMYEQKAIPALMSQDLVQQASAIHKKSATHKSTSNYLEQQAAAIHKHKTALASMPQHPEQQPTFMHGRTQIPTSQYVDQHALTTYKQNIVPAATSQYFDQHASAMYEQRTTPVSDSQYPDQQASATYKQNTKPEPMPLEQQASAIYRHMLFGSDSTEWKLPQLKQDMSGQVGDVLFVLRSFPDIFHMNKAKGLANLKCPLAVCSQHWKPNGCSNTACDRLHICKYFVLSSCKSSNCKYGHSFDTTHNKELLVQCRINKLPTNQKKQLLKRADAFREEMVPSICKFHNNPAKQCYRSQNGGACQFMHICEPYLTNNACQFNDYECPNSHDLMSPQVRKILEKYGFTVTYQAIPKIMQQLRASYRSKESGGPGNKSSDKPNDDRPKDVDMRAVRTQKDERPKFTTKSTKICTFNLRGKCKYGKKCQLLHTKLPYVWQYNDNGTWTPFGMEANDELERAFCQPENIDVVVSATGDASRGMKVIFQSMTYEWYSRGEIRRCSTESWGRAFKNRPFITKWIWFWSDENDRWQEYRDKVESIEIEEIYTKGNTDEIEFDAGHHTYTLNFTVVNLDSDIVEMKQTNKHYGTKREVRRRPKLFQKPAKRAEKGKANDKDTLSELVNIPETWRINNEDDLEPKLVNIPENSAEYQQVAVCFAVTMSEPIKRILRIQNLDLWEEYTSMRKRMLKQRSVPREKLPSQRASSELCRELNENFLFHGTKEKYIEPIYTNRGFDFRNAGTSVGTLYGKGNYFARDAKYSSCYTDCKRLFVVRVLVGEIAQGESDFTKPPPLDPNKPLGRLYDCCVNNVLDPSIYVTFEFGQSYPAYLIEF